MDCIRKSASFFFFNDTATTEIYTLSLHDALPILKQRCKAFRSFTIRFRMFRSSEQPRSRRSEEHTSELQSRSDLVCRLLLEKKKTYDHLHHTLILKSPSPNTVDRVILDDYSRNTS